MFELIKLSERTYYIAGMTNVGVYDLGGGEVCLIDSGNTSLIGKRLLKIINGQGWHLKTIYNTHCHSDHIGGNSYLQEQTGCKIYSPGSDTAFIRHPVLSPGFLFGGCPFPDILGRTMAALPSQAEYLTFDALPGGVEIIDLKGHSGGQVGYRTPDNIVFLGDSVIGRGTLDMLGTGYMYDFTTALDTMEYIKTLKAGLFVPSHAEPTDDIISLAQYNIDSINRLCNRVTELCSEKKSFEDVLAWFFENYTHTVNMENYATFGSTIRSLLVHLMQTGKVDAVLEENRLFWVKNSRT